MARPVKHDYGNLGYFFTFSGAYSPDVFRYRSVYIENVFGLRTGNDFVHVYEVAGAMHGAAGRKRYYGNRPGQPASGQGSTVYRIDRDIHFRVRTITDFLTDIKHGRFIFFPFTDNNNTIHTDKPEDVAHGMYRRPIHQFLIPFTKMLRRSHSGGFCTAHQL